MDNIIKELEEILSNEDFKQEYLVKYEEYYKKSLINFSKLCLICENLEKDDLPHDCLYKPSYCVKDEKDNLLINLYEDLEMYIEMKDNFC